MKSAYIRAVVELQKSGSDVSEILSGLARTLKARGHTKLHRAILQGVLIKLGETKGDAATVTYATKGANEDAALREVLKKLGSDGEYSTEIDESIIGGFTVEFDHTFIDASYKGELLKVYKNITH